MRRQCSIIDRGEAQDEVDIDSVPHDLGPLWKLQLWATLSDTKRASGFFRSIGVKIQLRTS